MRRHVCVALQSPTKRQSLVTNLRPSGSLCNVATKSRINVHIFGLPHSLAPWPGPCLRRAGNVWSTRAKEADQSQCLWSASLWRVVTFLRRCTLSYTAGYGEVLSPTRRLHHRYSIDLMQKPTSGLRFGHSLLSGIMKTSTEIRAWCWYWPWLWTSTQHGNDLGTHRKQWRMWLGRTVGLLCFACCLCNPEPHKWQKMDWWL